MKLLNRLMARQAKLIANLDPLRAEKAAAPPHFAAPTATHDPEAEGAARRLAAFYLERGSLAAARATLEPFMPSGRDLGTFTTLARICTEQGDLVRALAALKRAEALDSANRKVWRLTAKLLTTQRRSREALVYLRRIALADADAPASAHVDLLRGLFRVFDKSQRSAGASRATRAELELVLKRFEAAPGIDDKLRMQFPGLYYLLSSGSPEAVRLYNTAAPCPPSHRDVTAQLVSLDKWSARQRLNAWRGSDLETPNQGHALYSLENVQIHPAMGWLPLLADGAAMPSGHVLLSKHFRATSPHSPLMLVRGTHAELRLPREMVHKTAPAVLVGGSESYYETLVHQIAGLAVVERSGLARDLPLVGSSHMAAFQRELLALLGYGSNRLIEVADDRPAQFRTLHVPAALAVRAQRVDPLVVRWYRSRLASREAPEPHRRLYVVPGPSVPIANADEVSALMVSHGFEQVDVVTMNVQAQIDLFSQARQVVGATSEGIANILFLPPGSALLELRPINWVASGGHLHFELLARACGHQYVVEECLRAGSSGAGEMPITVDIDQLRKHLGAWS